MTSCTCTVFPACNHAKASSSQGKHNLLFRQGRLIAKKVTYMSTVYVLNKDGKPLMPTTRGGHVRHLLKEQKAKEHHPAYRNLNRNYPGSVFLVGKQAHVMQGIASSKDGKTTKYNDTNATTITAGKCKFVAKNSGILFVQCKFRKALSDGTTKKLQYPV